MSEDRIKYIRIGADCLVEVTDHPNQYAIVHDFENEGVKFIKENQHVYWVLENDAIQKPLELTHFKGELFPFQREDALKIINYNRFLLANDVGTGKSIISIAVLCSIKNENKKREKILLVCPSSIRKQWRREFEIHSSFTTAFWEDDNFKEADVQIISYSRLRLMRPEIHYFYVIYDEAGAVKNYKAEQTKAAYNINATYKLLLTGTPIRNEPNEIYSLLTALDLAKYKFGTVTDFLTTYGIREYMPYLKKEVTTGYKNIDKLRDELKPIMIARKKNSPDIIEQLGRRFDFIEETRFVDMNNSQLKVQAIIDSWVEDELSKFSNKPSFAEIMTNPKYRGVKGALISSYTMSRLNAIGAAYAYESDSISGVKIRTRLPSIEIDHTSSKFFDVLAILGETSGKTVIFTSFEKVVEELAFFLTGQKIDICVVTGSTRNMDLELEKFRTTEIPVLIATNVLGVGVNLQCAENIINVDLPFTWAEYSQRIGRLNRIGQKAILTVFNILSEGSIDEKILQLVLQKKDYHDIITS